MRKILLLTVALAGAAAVNFHAPDVHLSARLHAQANANAIVDPSTYQDCAGGRSARSAAAA